MPLKKIQEEVELYDNWAVFRNSTYRSDMDKRVTIYADKMLEDAQNLNINFEVIFQYDLGLILNDNSDKISDENDWFRKNSWRYGFICTEKASQESGLDFRYVGVFPAEQMYYSGVTLKEYADSVKKYKARTFYRALYYSFLHIRAE
ncbi:MAG: hypothetical protein FWG33_03350 [Oscillospiraceae bacterium]|nr:hypothetical protein [Oscillospiraceae bacterium]